MESVSTRLDDETARLIRETADERGVSMAEILREYIEKGMDYDELKRENERLRAEKRTLINDREERTDLVECVEQERDLPPGGAQGFTRVARGEVVGYSAARSSLHRQI